MGNEVEDCSTTRQVVINFETTSGMLMIFRSPANVDAAKEWRENYPEFKKKVARCVRKSQEELI